MIKPSAVGQNERHRLELATAYANRCIREAAIPDLEIRSLLSPVIQARCDEFVTWFADTDRDAVEQYIYAEAAAAELIIMQASEMGWYPVASWRRHVGDAEPSELPTDISRNARDMAFGLIDKSKHSPPVVNYLHYRTILEMRCRIECLFRRYDAGSWRELMSTMAIDHGQDLMLYLGKINPSDDVCINQIMGCADLCSEPAFLFPEIVPKEPLPSIEVEKLRAYRMMSFHDGVGRGRYPHRGDPSSELIGAADMKKAAKIVADILNDEIEAQKRVGPFERTRLMITELHLKDFAEKFASRTDARLATIIANYFSGRELDPIVSHYLESNPEEEIKIRYELCEQPSADQILSKWREYDRIAAVSNHNASTLQSGYSRAKSHGLEDFFQNEHISEAQQYYANCDARREIFEIAATRDNQLGFLPMFISGPFADLEWAPV